MSRTPYIERSVNSSKDVVIVQNSADTQAACIKETAVTFLRMGREVHRKSVS